MKKIILIFILVFTISTVGCSKDENNSNINNSTDTNINGSEEKIFAGDASRFKTMTLSGKSISSEIFKDYDVTMINIWATWCESCLNELPELQKVYENLPDGANMITVCIDAKQSTSKAQEIISTIGASFPVLFVDEKLEKSLVYLLNGYPSAIFVDSTGKSIAPEMLNIPDENASEIYLSKIKELLEKQKNIDK